MEQSSLPTSRMFCHPKKNTHVHDQLLPHFLPPLLTHWHHCYPCSVSADLPILNISHKLNPLI